VSSAAEALASMFAQLEFPPSAAVAWRDDWAARLPELAAMIFEILIQILNNFLFKQIQI
jgi:hypothetical protein